MSFTATPCGFGMTFDNGIRISVQWSDTNYCHARLKNPDDYERYPASVTAEIAIMPANDKDVALEWFNFGNETVKGWVTTNEVADWISIVSIQPDWKSLIENKVGILHLLNKRYNSTDNEHNLRTEEINEQGDEEE